MSADTTPSGTTRAGQRSSAHTAAHRRDASAGGSYQFTTAGGPLRKHRVMRMVDKDTDTPQATAQKIRARIEEMREARHREKMARVREFFQPEPDGVELADSVKRDAQGRAYIHDPMPPEPKRVRLHPETLYSLYKGGVYGLEVDRWSGQPAFTLFGLPVEEVEIDGAPWSVVA